MTKTATLYRMVTDEHICPYGLRSKDLLERQGYDVEDHKLISHTLFLRLRFSWFIASATCQKAQTNSLIVTFKGLEADCAPISVLAQVAGERGGKSFHWFRFTVIFALGNDKHGDEEAYVDQHGTRGDLNSLQWL